MFDLTVGPQNAQLCAQMCAACQRLKAFCCIAKFALDQRQWRQKWVDPYEDHIVNQEFLKHSNAPHRLSPSSAILWFICQSRNGKHLV